ncbi:MAG: alpha/beta hydrolase fold domain-containing protein, partial [Gallionellaceae bacterium]|nr:alpha/beta hydrolase fold domain-containing protein [Gallionellaceae bacterium]
MMPRMMNLRPAALLRRYFLSLGCCLLPLGFCLPTGSARAQTPAQMEMQFDPHAAEQRHTHAAVSVMTLGDGAQRVYVFMPAQPALHGKVPMVFFHHGWRGMNPMNFGALIDHLARSGQVVIYPVYQDSDSTSPQVVTRNAAAADRRALAALNERYRLTPDPQRILYYGFSMGAAISLNFALEPKRYGLPAPRALVLAAPGDAMHVARGDDARSIIGPVEMLPSDLPIVMLAGSADTAIGLPTARLLAGRLCGIRSDRRALFVLPSDEHDGKKVNAGHGA